MGDLTVRFWGVRGSHAVSGKDVIRTGGNSACVEVNAGGNMIIFDAGTGFINFGRDLKEKYLNSALMAKSSSLVVYLFFTHTHHDHTEGLPFFEPAFFGRTTLYMFGPKMLSQDLSEMLSHAMIPPFFPITLDEMVASKVIQNVSEKNNVIVNGLGTPPVVINKFSDKMGLEKEAVRINMLKNYSHPRDGVLVYSVEYDGKKIIFATDVEGYIGGDQKLINFAKGADLLIHDAQFSPESYADNKFPKQGWWHSTVDMAADVAKTAGVKKLVLFHHDPYDTDAMVDEKEKAAVKLFKNSVAAREGMEITI